MRDYWASQTKPSELTGVLKDKKLPDLIFILDMKNILWFFAAAILLSSIFYAAQNHVRIKRFENQIQSARSALEKQSILMERRFKRDVDVGVADENVDEENQYLSLNYGGATYIRWGRSDCPEKTLTYMIYKGQAAATHYSHSGGGSNYICVFGNITYEEGKYVEGGQGSSHIYGVEFRDSAWVYNLFNLSETENNALQYHSLPCAMCINEIRISQMMIPGRETCPGGWEKEYSGYIMAGGHGDTHTSEFICVDERPHVIPGTEANSKGAFLFMVETQCPSLLCEPVVAGRELRCVVCSA